MTCVRSSVFCVFLVALAALSGCYTVEFHETDHPLGLTPIAKGPGGAEGELFECVELERHSYSGEKLAIGLFPGHPFFTEGLGLGPVAGSAVYALWCPIGNVLFAVPTLCTLLIEPFVEANPKRKVQNGDVLSLGLVGAFRWRSPSHVEIEEGARENVLLKGRYRVDVGKIPCRRGPEGTIVYLDYPGYRALKKVVDREGRVDVLFSDGSAVRRFRRSKRDAERLVYEDFTITPEFKTYWERERALARKLERQAAESRKEP